MRSAPTKKKGTYINSLLLINSLFNSLFLLVSQDKESMFEVMKMVDKASGYAYGKGEKTNLPAMMSTAVGAEFDFFKYPFQNWA